MPKFLPSLHRLKGSGPLLRNRGANVIFFAFFSLPLSARQDVQSAAVAFGSRIRSQTAEQAERRIKQSLNYAEA